MSFNCKSIKRSYLHVRELCKTYDIIALQELWLIPDEIDFLNTIHPDFGYYGISAVDTSAGPLKGRPFGGVAVLWRKSSFANVVPIESHSTRIAAVRVNLTDRCFIVMSVYMPTECADNLPLFTECLGKMSAIVEDSDVENVIMLGDFNADVNSIFGDELEAYCLDQEWVCVDISILGKSSGTYTYRSDAHGTTSWLDHCIVTTSAANIVSGVCVLEDVYWSDHLPLAINCDINIIKYKTKNDIKFVNKIVWGNRENDQKSEYNRLCTKYLENVIFPDFPCAGDPCSNQEHIGYIDIFYTEIIRCLSKAAIDSYEGKSAIKKKYITGWMEPTRQRKSLKCAFSLSTLGTAGIPRARNHLRKYVVF